MEASASAIGTRFAPRIPAALFRLGDERLARLVAVGHERAFALLYERYHQPLYRYLRSMLGQDADAQDALQSAFASAFAALKAGRRNAPLRSSRSDCGCWWRISPTCRTASAGRS